jgi:hypothetical protein
VSRPPSGTGTMPSSPPQNHFLSASHAVSLRLTRTQATWSLLPLPCSTTCLPTSRAGLTPPTRGGSHPG